MARNKKKTTNPEYKCGDNLTVRVYNNKVVEATLEGSEVVWAFEQYLENVLGDTLGKFIKARYSSTYTSLADKYIGRAFVNTDMGDTFDFETGKKLAIKRCMSLYHADFNAKIVELLNDIHTLDARIFNRLRKANHLDLYFKAKTVDEVYDTQFRMEGQPSFCDVAEDFINN